MERGSSTAPLAENGRQGHPSVRPPPTSAPALPAPSPAHPQPWAPHFRLVGTALPATSAALPVPGKAPDASQRTPPSNSCGRRPPPPRFSPPTSGAREAWLYPGSQWKSAVGGGGRGRASVINLVGRGGLRVRGEAGGRGVQIKLKKKKKESKKAKSKRF